MVQDAVPPGAADFDPTTRLAWVSKERMDSELARSTTEGSYDRMVRRELVALLVICWGWMLLGTFSILWSAHTTDVEAALRARVVAFGVGFGGTYFTILTYFVRRSERGDFDQ